MKTRVLQIMLLATVAVGSYQLGKRANRPAVDGAAAEVTPPSLTSGQRNPHRPSSQRPEEGLARLRKLIANGEVIASTDKVRWSEMINDFYAVVRANPEEGEKLLLELIKGQGPAEISGLYGFYAQAFAQEDPVRALQWSEALGDRKISNFCMGAVFSIWSQDPDLNAKAMLDTILKYKDRESVMGQLPNGIQKMAIQSPTAAADWIEANLQNDRNAYFNGLNALFSAVASNHPKQLIDLLNSYDLGERKSEILNQVAQMAAHKDLSVGLEIISAMGEDKTASDTLKYVGGNQFSSSHDQVLEFAQAHFPDKAAEIAGYGVSRWMSEDSTAAMEWIGQQSPDFTRSLLDQGIASQIASKDPGAALALVDSMVQDSATKERHYGAIAATWAQKDPNEAGQWIGTLSPEMQNRVVPAYVQTLLRDNRSSAMDVLNSQKLAPSAYKAAADQIRMNQN